MAKTRPRKKPVRYAGSDVAYKPPSLRDRMKSTAEMATRDVLEEHPLKKQLHKDMTNAIMGVVRQHRSSVRGPAARGRARSLFE